MPMPTTEYDLYHDLYWTPEEWRCVVTKAMAYPDNWAAFCEQEGIEKRRMEFGIMKHIRNFIPLLHKPKEAEGQWWWWSVGPGQNFSVTVRHSRDRLSFNVDVCEDTCIKRIQEFDDREFKSFMQLQSTPVPMLHGPYPLLAMVEAQCGNCMEVKGLDYLWNSTCSMSLQATNVCGPESWATNRELGMELAGRDDNNDEKMATVYAMLLKGTSVTLPFQQNLPGDNGILDLNEGLSGINVSIRYKQSFGSVAEASCSHESYRCITICIQKNGKKNPSPSSFTCRWEMLRNFIARLKKEQEGKAL